jgi:hypothetical protein
MNLFEELDSIITRAVNETMQKDERERQEKQSSSVDKLNLRAGDAKTDEVDEAEDEEGEEAEEGEEKLTGAGDTDKAKEKENSKDPESDTVAGTASSKKLKDPTRKQLSKPTFKTIASNINLLRGGKSIKDPEVRKNLKDYLSKLSADEKRQVLVYLNSLAQVMSGVKTGAEAAADPKHAEKKADIQTDKKTQRVSQKSDIIIVGE